MHSSCNHSRQELEIQRKEKWNTSNKRNIFLKASNKPSQILLVARGSSINFMMISHVGGDGGGERGVGGCGTGGPHHSVLST